MSDYIKRADALAIVRKRFKKYTTPCVAAVTELQELPTADARENVRGKWWHEPHTNNTWIQRCSNCFQIAMITFEEECPYNYCPICGADMRGGRHENNA